MITKEEALKLLHSNMQSVNLRKHCYSVAAVMRALAKHFGENEDLWEITGLVHDIDYEKDPKTHPMEGLKILKKEAYSKEIIDAVAAHAWGYHEGLPKPKNKMEWSLYCCDELTGLVVACALVRPDKKLSSLTEILFLRNGIKKLLPPGLIDPRLKTAKKNWEFLLMNLSTSH
jgi:putative nucleotidyltransferase with HDIG domain